jgi:hypothetical protein
VRYTENHYDHGDEADEGYADEDGSMDLSDAVEESTDDNVIEEDQSVFVDEDDLREYVWSDGDTMDLDATIVEDQDDAVVLSDDPEFPRI